MPPCKHHEICGLDALDGTGEELCILHSHNLDKDKKDFEKALTECRKKKSDFRYFVFPRLMDFTGEEFAEVAYFDCAEFTGEAYFCGAEFTARASFSFAKFTGRAVFSEAKFTGETSFAYAKFTGSPDFSDAEFTARASFSSAEFTEGAFFQDAKFTGEADFSHAKFTGNACFMGEFKGEADFSHAKFTEEADFIGAEFTGRASFRLAEFTGEASFRLAEFTEGASFNNARFLGRTYLPFEKANSVSAQSHSGLDVDFRNVIIEPLDAVIFRDADLRRCRFLGTDLRKVEFTNVTWPKKGGRFRVWDEDVELEVGETRDSPHIERLYRQLKQNYEDRKDYERASDFHYGEKEMRRRNPDTSWGLRFLLTLYWLVSGYGERWVRPLIWAAGLLVLCAVLYLFLPSGLHLKNGGPALAWTSLSDWFRSAFYSFRVMTLLRPDDLIPFGYAKIVQSFESLIGPVILGLLALAVRQRLKR